MWLLKRFCVLNPDPTMTQHNITLSFDNLYVRSNGIVAVLLPVHQEVQIKQFLVLIYLKQFHFDRGNCYEIYTTEQDEYTRELKGAHIDMVENNLMLLTMNIIKEHISHDQCVVIIPTRMFTKMRSTNRGRYMLHFSSCTLIPDCLQSG